MKLKLKIILIKLKRKKVKVIKVVEGIKFDDGFIDDKGVYHPIKGKEKIKIPSEDSEEFKYALWIKEIFGGDIHMVPEMKVANGSKQKSYSCSTPDYIWNNEKWDLKGIDGNSEKTLKRIFWKSKRQTDNLILFPRKTLFTDKQMIFHINKAFAEYKFSYNRIIYLRDFKVIEIFEK